MINRWLTDQQTAASIVFNIKNKEGLTKSYLLDLKDTGKLSDLKDPKSVQPDITINIGDLDFKKLVLGKSNAQKLFMSGKLKIKGNVMKLANIENILKSANPLKLKLWSNRGAHETESRKFQSSRAF